ncbi:hypothetical protein KA111_02230, partial [Candidatus Woesebacteria bacterium]|nr:hypothetical protein [Candidatus Woesebacteria bacterium]
MKKFRFNKVSLKVVVVTLFFAVFLMLGGYFNLSKNPINFKITDFLINFQVYADDVDDLQREIDELQHLKELSESANKTNEATLNSLESRINNARNSIKVAKEEAAALS